MRLGRTKSEERERDARPQTVSGNDWDGIYAIARERGLAGESCGRGQSVARVGRSGVLRLLETLQDPIANPITGGHA